MSIGGEQKKLLGTILRGEGWLLFIGGLILATKHYYADFELRDAQMDKTIGYGLMLVGFANIFIANKFFKRDAQ